MELHTSSRSLLELISEKNAILRQQAEEKWQHYGDIDISPAEWNFLMFVEETPQTVAELARSAGISRQAAHKFFKNLEAKDIVEIPEQKSELRHVMLTSLGKDCYQQYHSLQQRLEDSVRQVVGEENVAELKRILTKQWLSDTEKQAQ